VGPRDEKTVTLSVNVADLPLGTYNAIITVSENGGPATPLPVEVVLEISQTNCEDYDPTIPTLRYLVDGRNFGVSETIAAGQVKRYYIHLPDELPLIQTDTIYRPALLFGQNYGQLEINLLDRTNIATFTATITNPHGEVYPLTPSEGLYFIKFQNQMPAYPGRYLLTVSAQIPAPYTKSNLFISWGARPSPLMSELTD